MKESEKKARQTSLQKIHDSVQAVYGKGTPYCFAAVMDGKETMLVDDAWHGTREDMTYMLSVLVASTAYENEVEADDIMNDVAKLLKEATPSIKEDMM